jgi:hypothetical protein
MIKTDVIEANRKHPGWSADQVAAFLGISQGTVRSVGNREHLRFAPKCKPKEIIRLGKRVPFAGRDPRGTDQW